MRPLVYYCRWRGAKLRLAGRDEQRVWGRLAIETAEGEEVETFSFDQETWELFLGEGDEQRRLLLDDMGVVVEDSGQDG